MRSAFKFLMIGIASLLMISPSAAEDDFVTAHGVSAVRIFDYALPTSKIVICVDSKSVKFEEIQKFMSEYLWDKNYQLFDGLEYDSTDLDGVTLAYIGEPTFGEANDTCLDKFSELKGAAIELSQSEPRYIDGNQLSPSLPEGEFQPPTVYAASIQGPPDKRSHLYVGLCFSQKLPCLDGVVPSLFGLKFDFCFQADTCSRRKY